MRTPARGARAAGPPRVPRAGRARRTPQWATAGRRAHRATRPDCNSQCGGIDDLHKWYCEEWNSGCDIGD